MIYRQRIKVEKFRREPTEDGHGHKSVSVGFEDCEICVCIDEKAIAEVLGPRAVRSKGGKCVEIRGLVKVIHQRTTSRQDAVS